MPVNWNDRRLVCLKYVDDCLSLEKLCFSNAERFNVDGRMHALSSAMKTQSHFNTVEYNAAQRGMIINNNKTKLMCISAARSYAPSSYIVMSNGDKIETVSSMKSLGFHFDTSPTVKYHMKLSINTCLRVFEYIYR